MRTAVGLEALRRSVVSIEIDTNTAGKRATSPAGDSNTFFCTLLTGDGTRVTRPLRWLASVVRHPIQFARTLSPRGWSRRSITLLVMQTLDNAITLRARPRRLGSGVRLHTKQNADRPNQTFIPVANQAAELLAGRIDGIAQSNISEAFANIPTTAHLLGCAVIASDLDHGVVERYQRVFGYQNLLVCDGAAVPANVGVNRSLRITALAEHAISHVPAATVASDAPPAEVSSAPHGVEAREERMWRAVGAGAKSQPEVTL